MKVHLELREKEHAQQNNRAKRWARFVAADNAYGRALLTGIRQPEGTTRAQELDRLESKRRQAERDWLHNTPILREER